MTKQKEFPFANLKFSCLEKCHKCCSGVSGIVLVTENEMEKISSFLSLEKREFIKIYTRIIENYCSNNFGFIEEAYTIKEKANHECIFLENGKCSIYPVRPLQCKAYPFWPTIVSSKTSWEKEKEFCPGINRGKTHTKKEIKEILEKLKNQDYSVKNY